MTRENKICWVLIILVFLISWVCMFVHVFNCKVEVELWKVTAYCPCEICCGEYADGVTASGYAIKFGDKFCAAPKSIEFGTWLDIPGYGVVEVKDRGGVIVGKRIDVYFDTHQEALNWGVRFLKIKTIKGK